MAARNSATRATPADPARPPQGPNSLDLAAAYLLAGAGLAVVVVLLMGWQGVARPRLLVGSTVAAAVIGGAMLVAHRRELRVPMLAQYGIVLAGVVLISASSLAIGGTEGAVFACTYTFALAITAMHYPMRDVINLFVLVAGAYAAVVWTEGGTVAQWVLVVGVAGASGLLTGRYQRHVHGLARQLQHLESWRSLLMSSLAHDLRSPLGIADSTLELLEERTAELTIDQRRELVSAARRHQRRAIQLARDLLDHERVHAGVLELGLRATVLRDTFVEACENAAVEVKIDVSEHLVADADPGRLQQIVVNLVTNADKYGSGPIVVGASPRDDTIECWVRDHGPGLSPRQQEAVFTRFGAGDAEESVGLGLWIVEQLVRAHGGQVRYEDADPGAKFVWTMHSTIPARTDRGRS